MYIVRLQRPSTLDLLSSTKGSLTLGQGTWLGALQGQLDEAASQGVAGEIPNLGFCSAGFWVGPRSPYRSP